MSVSSFLTTDHRPLITVLKLRFLNDLHNTPAFSCRHWPRFDDADLIAHLRSHLIVGHKLLPAADIFAIDRMFDQAVDTDSDRLGHFVRSDNADLLGTLMHDRFLFIARTGYSRNDR